MIENMTKEELNKPYKSIRENNLEQLQILINNGLDVNKIDSNGQLLIATAITFSNLEAVKLLVENGADVNLTVNNLPLITLALIYGDIELFRLLIEKGADVNAVANNQPIILDALVCGNNEAVKLLVENGAEIEFPNSNTTLLEQALLFSNDEITELCISKGSKFPQHILFDVAQRKDGYVFNRELILEIINKKNEIIRTNLYNIEEDIESIILNKEKTIKLKNKMHEMKKDIDLEKNNNEISRYSLELNVLHNRLNKIRKNMLNMINRISDIQDRMTTSKIIDFIKTFIKYGGDVNYKDENGSTVLMLLSYFGYEDCVKLLIENGAKIDIQNSGIETPLLLAYENNHFNVVKLLIESGADVNITMDNGESFYKKVKNDENYEVLEYIENSPTYIKITHNPERLVEILKNFTLQSSPIRYTVHEWELFHPTKSEYKSFDGYMSAVKKQFDSIKSELQELSPNLYKKIHTFLIEENQDENYSWCSKANINIGWSSLIGLKEWCDSGKKAEDYKLPKPIFIGRKQIAIFGEVIDLFKQEIEVRSGYKITDEANIDLSKREFYTDTEVLKNVLGKVFNMMKKQDDKDQKNHPREATVSDKEDGSVEIKITQIDSTSSRSAEELYERANIAGDISEIKKSLNNLCDWSIESSFKDEHFRVNFLHSNNVKDIEMLESKPKGFTHILRFYK